MCLIYFWATLCNTAHSFHATSRSSSSRLQHFLQVPGDAEELPNTAANDDEEVEDTVRVRIWRALASGDELSLKQLGAAVGDRKELRSHLKHVEKQAQTLKNKSTEWCERRGLSVESRNKVNKLRLKTRRGNKNELFIRLE